MADQSFDNREEAEKFLADWFERTYSFSVDASRSMAADVSLVFEEKQETSRPKGSFAAIVPLFKWVIRDDDLQLMRAAFDGLKAATSVGFFTAAGISHPAKWASAVAIIATIVQVIRQAKKKGKWLKDRDFALIHTLHGNRTGLSLTALLEQLKSWDNTWTADEVDERLKNLKSIPVSDGTLRAFVVCDEYGMWRTSGI